LTCSGGYGDVTKTPCTGQEEHRVKKTKRERSKKEGNQRIERKKSEKQMKKMRSTPL
jgi:hypothetical protein